MLAEPTGKTPLHIIPDALRLETEKAQQVTLNHLPKTEFAKTARAKKIAVCVTTGTGFISRHPVYLIYPMKTCLNQPHCE